MPRRFALTKFPGRKGQCTLALTGCTTVPTAVFDWRIYNDDLVFLALTAASASGSLSGVSNSTSATLTGLPAEISPVTDAIGTVVLFDNGQNQVCAFYIGNNSTIIRLDRGVVVGTSLTNSPTGWTAAGNKGFGTYTSFIYRLRRV